MEAISTGLMLNLMYAAKTEGNVKCAVETVVLATQKLAKLSHMANGAYGEYTMKKLAILNILKTLLKKDLLMSLSAALTTLLAHD